MAAQPLSPGRILLDAVESGRIASVRKALRDGGRLAETDALSRTPLHIAATHGRGRIVGLLLEHRAKVSAKDYHRNTALHAAAGAGHLGVVEQLLCAGASARLKNSGKCTALHELARGGGVSTAASRVKLVTLLLEAGCPLNARDSAGRTALWFAASTGTLAPSSAIRKSRRAVLVALLEAGAKRVPSATHPPITPLEAAQGLHQSKKYRIVWPDAVALLS